MKGIELSRSFYLEHGAPMIHSEFAQFESIIAVGLAGSGSECFGYDDEISRDHDFEPGFCLFIPDEDVIDRRTCFLLERAYAKLPKEYMGIKRNRLNPVGGNRHGVIRMSDFFETKTGCKNGELSLSEWFSVPEYALAEAINGEVFRDDYGQFSAIRSRLSNMPESVRLKKIAGNLLLMGQSGQYNYNRCLSHGEPAAAQLAVFEFVKSAMNVVFLLNKRYMPYYKWSFRAMRELPLLSSLSDSLEYLLTSENDQASSKTKSLVIEDIAAIIISELQKQNLSDAVGNDIEKHAYSVNGAILDADIRNLHILFAV